MGSDDWPPDMPHQAEFERLFLRSMQSSIRTVVAGRKKTWPTGTSALLSNLVVCAAPGQPELGAQVREIDGPHLNPVIFAERQKRNSGQVWLGTISMLQGLRKRMME